MTSHRKPTRGVEKLPVIGPHIAQWRRQKLIGAAADRAHDRIEAFFDRRGEHLENVRQDAILEAFNWKNSPVRTKEASELFAYAGRIAIRSVEMRRVWLHHRVEVAAASMRASGNVRATRTRTRSLGYGE